MAGNSTIAITVKLTGDGSGLNSATIGTKELRDAIAATISEADKLSNKMVNFTALSVGIDSVTATISGALNVLSDLSSSYAVQETVETKLATAMRNTMHARESEIQSIKDLCSAQQEIGVIGDEVQLAGAQELATYLTMSDTLKTLIPVMNDMVAQQYGLEASGESATQIATMLGKVMNGQVNALSRYGYSFDEAQEQILKFGTESERAAVLAEVVGQSVGGMNQALAQTDSGKQKQLENTLGDIKERLGELASQALPFVTLASSCTIALGGVVKLIAGVKTATAAVAAWNVKGLAMSAVCKLVGVSSTKSSALVRVFSSAMKGGAYSATAFKLALQGLLISTGVGAAIVAVTEAISFFSQKAQEASDAIEEHKRKLEEHQRELEEHKRALEEARKSYTDITSDSSKLAAAELKTADALMAVATDETKTYAQRLDAIKKLKKEYPEYFSKVNTERISIDELTSSYNTLKDAILKASEARAAQSLMDKNSEAIIEKRLKKEQLRKEMEELSPSLSNATQRANVAQRRYDKKSNKENRESLEYARARENELGSKWDELYTQYTEINDDLSALGLAQTELEKIVENAGNYVFRSGSNGTDTGGNKSKAAKQDVAEYNEEIYCIQDIIDNISVLEEMKKTAAQSSIAELNQQIDKWQALKKEWEESGRSTEIWHEQCRTLQEYDENLDTISKRMKTATAESMPELQRQREELQAGRDALANLGKTVEDTNPKLNTQARTLSEINENIEYYTKLLDGASLAEASTINESITLWQKKADAIRNAGKETATAMEQFRSGFSSIKGVNDGVKSLKETLEGHNTVWEKTLGVVDAGLKIYDGIDGAVKLVKKLTGAKTVETAVEVASTAAKESNAVASGLAGAASAEQAGEALAATGALSAEATANVTDAAAKTMNAHAWLPFVGIGLAAAMVGVMIATMKGLPKFADGGIAYGPTLGLFGEYPGAGNNPEVVAPLDKLRGLLQPTGGAIKGPLEFRIRRGDLWAVLKTEETYRSRT